MSKKSHQEIATIPYGELTGEQRRAVSIWAASGHEDFIEATLAQTPPNTTLLSAISSIAALRKAQEGHSGSSQGFQKFDDIESRIGEVLSVAEAI